MALWRTDLRVSWLARRCSLLLHSLVALALVLAPWPAELAAVQILPLALTVFEYVRSQRRIRSRKGDIALLAERRLRWRQKSWRVCGRPWVTQRAILLALITARGEREALWLLRDSMDEAEWRQLRRQLMTAE